MGIQIRVRLMGWIIVLMRKGGGANLVFDGFESPRRGRSCAFRFLYTTRVRLEPQREQYPNQSYLERRF